MEADNSVKTKSAYGKRPLWQWIALYVVVGIIVYGAIYYGYMRKQNPYNNQASSSQQTQTNPTKGSSVMAKNAVTIQNMAFSPATLTVKVGDKVTWTNQDSVGHSATADDSSFDTGVIAQGQSGSNTFAKAGTYTYHCSVHPNMKATIIVQ